MLWTDIAHKCNVLLTQKLLMLGLIYGPMDELLKIKFIMILCLTG